MTRICGFIFVLTVLAAYSYSLVTTADEKKTSAGPLKVSVDKTEASANLDDVNQGRFTISLALKNTSKVDIVLWPYLSVQVLDADGKLVQKSRNLGRWGLIRSPSVLEEVRFVTVKPGKTHTIEFNMKQYMFDADTISAWRLEEPGEHKARLHYAYDRAKVKKKYGIL